VELEKIILETEDTEFEEFLHNKIRAFNNENSSFHRQVRKPDAIKYLYLVLKDKTGSIVGGLAAAMYWDWLEIKDFFVPVAARGEGLGAELLSQVESIAFGRGYTHVYLTTYEFQARRFYEKQGYYIVGTLEGYPPGSAYYWMRKDLKTD